MPEESQTQSDSAKKVFFLYPHGIVKSDLLKYLILAEMEVALVEDHQKLSMLLHRYKSSIVFINVEVKLNEAEWDQYIRALMADRPKHDARIGILSYAPQPALQQKYAKDIGVPCGYIALNQGIRESAGQLLKVLGEQGARGRRKFVRIACPEGKGVLNINQRGQFFSGTILDISVAGMSCILNGDIGALQTFDDIQLQLWGARLKMKAQLAGSRKDTKGNTILVLMFEPDSVAENRDRIHQFINRVHQSLIDGQ